jgi:tryptophan-rich sensory protein
MSALLNRGAKTTGSWLALAASYGAAQAVSAAAARRLRSRPIPEQYRKELCQPRFAPPTWVFPVAWSLLNVTTATSAWRLWRRDAGSPGREAGLAWWFLALLVRSGYVPLAFGRRQLWLATADAALLALTMTVYAAQARRADSPAAALALPEIGWTAFAAVLSAAIAHHQR